MQNIKFASVDDYVAAQPADAKARLEAMRKIIKNAAPDAEEVISYGMPAFKQNGILVFYAVWKSHVGFYPSGSGISAFADELAMYKTSKGAVQFPFDEELPEKLIAQIVRHRIKENDEKASKKAKK
ncbi:MAG: DUF1801 domain-containing protein [Flavobacterium sp.]|nr:MAG: DUF1801 domain-containing protein [Flavobacterium sp.]